MKTDATTKKDAEVGFKLFNHHINRINITFDSINLLFPAELVGSWLFLAQILCLNSGTIQRNPLSYWWSCARCLISTCFAYIVPTAKLLYRIVLPLIRGSLMMRSLPKQDIHTCIQYVSVDAHIHLHCAHASLSGQHPLLLLPLHLLIVNVLGSLIGLSGEHKSNRNRVGAIHNSLHPPLLLSDSMDAFLHAAR